MRYLQFPIFPVAGGGGSAIVNTFTTQTPMVNTLVTTGTVGGSAIGAAQTVEYTFDYLVAGTGTGSSVTTSGAFGTALNAGDVSTVLANTGSVITGTYGSITYTHRVSPNHDTSNNSTFPGDSGITVEESVVQGMEIRTRVLTGATVEYDQTDFKTYIQIYWDNATRDTNDTHSGSLITPAGTVTAWTNYEDLGGIEQTITPYQTGQLPAAGRNTTIANEVLGTGTATDYSTWFTATTGNAARAEYSYTNHGWGDVGSGDISFEINGTRVFYPNTYSTTAGNADTEWENFMEWALVEADPSLALGGAIVTNVMGVERRTHEASTNFTDRFGLNTDERENYAIARHRLGDVDSAAMDNNWGGHATTCYVPGNNFIASPSAMLATPLIGSMWHLSESGDFIKFEPRYYFR